MAQGFSLGQSSAIITGASSGLGAEFARQLAPHAKSLLLIARRESALNEVKARLLALRADLIVHLCVADVSNDEGRAHIVATIERTGIRPNLLINNAGIGDYGEFVSADPAKLRGQIDLNITALVLLTHAIVPKLIARIDAPAAVLNVSSLAGNVPMPDLAIYGASKAFVTSFSEALRVELMTQHIIVSALCPGPTPTNFGKTAKRATGSDTNRSGQGLLRVMPEVVVRAGLDALRHNCACVFPGTGVSLAAPLFRIMPRALMRWILARRFRKDHSPPPH